jgi:hypothetical protein
MSPVMAGASRSTGIDCGGTLMAQLCRRPGLATQPIGRWRGPAAGFMIRMSNNKDKAG